MKRIFYSTPLFLLEMEIINLFQDFLSFRQKSRARHALKQTVQHHHEFFVIQGSLNKEIIKLYVSSGGKWLVPLWTHPQIASHLHCDPSVWKVPSVRSVNSLLSLITWNNPWPSLLDLPELQLLPRPTLNIWTEILSSGIFLKLF